MLLFLKMFEMNVALPGLFRLSVGLEQPQELIADLNYALKEAFNESIIESITEQRFSS